MSDRNGFIIYHDDLNALDILTNDQLGRLVRMLLQYSEGYDADDIDKQELSIPFAFMSQKIDRDADRYQRIVEKRKKAAQKRWDNAGTDDANACK